MLESIKKINEFSENYNIPKSELISLLINIEGVNIDLDAQRVRFSLNKLNDVELLFSVQNTIKSNFKIINSQLIFDNSIIGTISNLCEDSCEIFYTRNNGRVLCFNPNSRSSCKGCKFCYSPKSSDDNKKISISEIYNALNNWLHREKLSSLSHIEQIAVVTGCFNKDVLIIEYLNKLKEAASELKFNGELLFFGSLVEDSTIYQLAKLKPLNLCFTIECFENRDTLVSKSKYLKLEKIIHQMEIAKSLGIKTNFSYIVGLDSLSSIKKNYEILSNVINDFPIVSIFQTDSNRIAIRNNEANSISYYLKARKLIEDIMKNTGYRPKVWNNHRSLWRLYYENVKL